jgi:hypothetical protein
VHGTAAVAAGSQAVVYVPPADFAGVDSFTYWMQDANGNGDHATVAVIVASSRVTDRKPIIAPIDPAREGRAVFTDTHATTTVVTPVGVYTGTLTAKDLFYLVYTPMNTPTGDVNLAPAGLKFGNFVFRLDAYINDILLRDFHFAQPVTLTVDYEPALLAGLEPQTLTLLDWADGAWRSEGIAHLAHDTAGHVASFRLGHVGEFAFFAAARILHLYLPKIQASAGAGAGPIEWPPFMKALPGDGPAGEVAEVASPLGVLSHMEIVQKGIAAAGVAPPVEDTPKVPAGATGIYLPAVQK